MMEEIQRPIIIHTQGLTEISTMPFPFDLFLRWVLFRTLAVMDEIETSTLVTLFINLEIVMYVKVASLAVLIYDTVVTLDQEYRYIWQRKWRVIQVLYLCSRYSTFVDTTIGVYERLDPAFTDCDNIKIFLSSFAGFGVGLSESEIMGFFILLWLVVGAVSFWANMCWSQSFESHMQTLPSGVVAPVRCYDGRASNIGLICYISLLAGETVIVLMTAWRAYSTWWSETRDIPFKTSPLIVTLYRDGILYFTNNLTSELAYQQCYCTNRNTLLIGETYNAGPRWVPPLVTRDRPSHVGNFDNGVLGRDPSPFCVQRPPYCS
ncbi:hypothetical protein PM082_013657 [Marasmius tenuissimus]|nr:hypothetical protein PM082_013657 [Marasmius tenuissimus]